MKENSKLEEIKIAILGFGREGQSVFKYLKKSAQFKKAKIQILDQKINKNYLKNIEKFDLVFRSPGIPYNLPELKRARQKGVYFSSVTRLFFENYKGKIIGVTGTKGKGTTSTLIYEMLKAQGFKVFLAGNIGTSAVEALLKYKEYPLAVLELSSFQLQDLNTSPQIALMLDIFPDHQDAHLDLKEYYEAKSNIGRFQKKTDKIFYLADNFLSKKLATKSPAQKIPVNYKKFNLFKSEDLKIKGLHNFRNTVMASTVAKSLGVTPANIHKIIYKFKGLEHRLEFVRAISGYTRTNKFKSGSARTYRAINFYNDSASTNPMTSAAALFAFNKEGKILIAGGQDKNLDYTPLRQAIKKNRTEAVILFGENKNKIKKTLGESVKINLVRNLKDAIGAAYKLAKTKEKDINIIFSPGAASFDMFKDYVERGNNFKAEVLRLTKTI